ncbi:latrophilin-like protein 1 isoform X2 [Mya arenaria]|nr:latrophilin-like protein 1 isoform X2 [Mya arenaria]
MTDRVSQGTICIQVNTAPKSWREAEAYCSGSISNLISLDRINDFEVFLPSTESISRVGDIVFDNYKLTEFWSGMYTSKEGRLMWDDYGPQFVRKFFPASWNWGPNEPDPTQGACGRTVLGTSPIGDTGDFQFNGSIEVSLTDCTRPLPFICKKDPVEIVVKKARFCEDNWYGNQYVPVCYQIFKEPLPFQEARASCESHKGKLAVAFTNFERRMIVAVFLFYERTDEYFTSKTVDQLWVNQTNVESPCTVYFTLRNDFAPVGTCDRNHLYICTKPTRFLGHPEFEIGGPYLDQNELLEYAPFTPLTLYGQLDRAFYEGEVGFVHTPTAILNSTSNYIQEQYPAQYTVKISEKNSTVCSVNVTFPLPSAYQRLPERKRRQGQSELFRSRKTMYPTRARPNQKANQIQLPIFYVDYGYIMRTTGYYTFGVYNINPPQSYEPTTPVLVRYSEADLYIYVAFIDFVPPGFKEMYIPMSAIHEFNLLKDENYLYRNEFTSRFTSRMLNSFNLPPALRIVANDYRGKIENISSSTLKMRIFVAPSVSRDTSTDLEQTVLQIVKEHLKTEANSFVFNPESIVIRSTVACPLAVTQQDGKNVTFPSTRIGSEAFSWERCYSENKALATADCGGNYDDGARWQNIRLAHGCGVVPAYNQSNSTVELKNMSETTFDIQNFKEILDITVNLTDPAFNLTEADVIYAADILYHYLDFDFGNTEEVMDYVFSITNNILRTSPESIDRAQKISNAANRIILSVDDLTNQVQLSTSDSLQFIRDFIASEIWVQDGFGDLVIGINLSNTTAKMIEQDSLSSIKNPDDVDVPTVDAAIYLDENLVKGSSSRLTFHIYAKTDIFSTAGNRFKINSKVAAVRLTKNGRNIVQLGDDSVTSVFHVFEDHSHLVCSYWDYSANEDAGGWKTEGCTMTSSVDNIVICKCNHLTNFAVLIDLKGGSGISEADKLALGIITKVGLSISIIGLGLTILTFIVFKHLRNGRGQQVLINLSVSMLCSAILFLVGVERTESRGGCIAVAALLHYFIIVSFMWMLVEGILQYLRFVKVLGTYIPKFMIKSMIPAWGIPLIPVIIVLAIDYDMYYGGKGYCWLSGDPLLYAFIIPIAVVILANLIVFTLVMCNLFRRKKNTMISNQSERKMAFLHFQAAVSIFVILGLTWVFGFMTVDDTRIVFHYLFALFNAFQGLFVFLFFTLREKQIRNAWRKLCCPKSVYKSATSSEGYKGKSANSDTKSTEPLGPSSNSTGYSNGGRQRSDI